MTLHRFAHCLTFVLTIAFSGLTAHRASAAEANWLTFADDRYATSEQVVLPVSYDVLAEDLGCESEYSDEELNTCACGCGDCEDCACGDGCRLFGLFLPSDHGFSDFISPMTNPVFFEDPRTLTEARAIFIQHRVPRGAGGGEVQLYAVQLRGALTERLSVIATKDGYITTSNPLIRDGWADLNIGLKYNLWSDYCNQRLLSAGLVYELPIGSTRAGQGTGDGEFHIFLTGGMQLGCDWHWISATGFRLPVNTNEESQSWYWSNHLDRRLFDRFYVFGEANWYAWMRSGAGGIAGVEGLDLFNFGSTGVAGNTIVTGAVGLKYKPHKQMELGIAYEGPLTDRKDIIRNRLTVDLILRY